MTEQVYAPVMVQIQSTEGIIEGWQDYVEADNEEHAKECIRLERMADKNLRLKYDYRIVPINAPTQGVLGT